MSRILARVALAAVAVAGLGYHGLHRAAEALADPGNEAAYPAASVVRGAGGLIVNGLIVPGTVARVEAALAAGGVRTVRITSAGGFVGAADALARRLNGTGTRLEVATLCSSACVVLLARVRPELRAVEDSAWLRVHGDGTGPGRDGPDDPEMADAVRILSPAWLRFLSGCATRPLARADGIAMRWAEIRDVRAGDDCRPVAHRTKEWLFART